MMTLNIDAMTDDELATWFENAEFEDFDSVIDGKIEVALARAKALETQAQENMRRTVSLAREEGRTWQEIGDALGMTRQGAHKRFAHA